MSERELTAQILVVEDNLTNARLTGGMLQAAGYRVAFAVDGAEGYEAARALAPTLIITDLQMPHLDGLSMLRLLKGDSSTARIPVLVLTAHVMPEHRESALREGCCCFVAKPIRYQQFIQEVQRALSDSVSGAYCDK